MSEAHFPPHTGLSRAAARLAIAGTWSVVTPINPAVAPDTKAAPNPTAQRK